MKLNTIVVAFICVAAPTCWSAAQDAATDPGGSPSLSALADTETDAPDVQSELPTKFAVAAIRPQGKGGERTRALISIESEGKATVNPTGSGAGYRVDMIMSMSSPFSGSTQPTYWLAGAEHVFRGKVALSGFTFDSDPKYCLTFKLLDAKGFVYLCGRGTVTTADGTVTRLGYEDNLDTWLPLLEAKTALAREAAAQAIGFLAFTDQEKKRVVPGLIKALDDEAMEVRRNAAEALGIIGDGQASDALASHTDEAKEKDKWVREVAEEAMKKINP